MSINKNIKILIGILILIIAISIGLILHFKKTSIDSNEQWRSKKTCIDSNEQCKGKPDGTKCITGVWCDSSGRVCGGQSCVGLGRGVCINNKCELSPNPYIEKQVIITTDKTEYQQGETVKIIIKNNSTQPIRVCYPFYAIERFSKGKWIKVPIDNCTCPGVGCQTEDCRSLQGGELFKTTWLQTEAECPELIQVIPGKYRATYTRNGKTFYSEPFTIKEKKINCSELNEEECRDQSSCIPLGYAEKAIFPRGESEHFVFEECVKRVPPYENCEEVVIMTQMYGGSRYPKECRCCCGEGPYCEKKPYPKK